MYYQSYNWWGHNSPVDTALICCFYLLFQQPSKKGRRHATYKLHIGWKHCFKGEYRQITSRRGGGTRIIPYNVDEPQTVESLTNLGKTLFFPEGKNAFGDISDMEIELTNYSGELIRDFKDREGNTCTFQDFLKSTGRYSSQYFVYLQTKKKNVKKELESDLNNNPACNAEVNKVPSFLVNGIAPKAIHVKYTKFVQSVYSSNVTAVTCNSIEECEMLTNQIDNDEAYNPLENGFHPTYVAVDGHVYMQHDINAENITISFPQRGAECFNSTDILHGPEEVHGMDGDKLILCVISKLVDANYTWYRNNEIIAAGTNLSVVPVTVGGQYKVAIQQNGTLYQLEQVVTIQIISAGPTMETMPSSGVTATTSTITCDTVTPAYTQGLDTKTPAAPAEGTLSSDMSMPTTKTDKVIQEAPASSQERMTSGSVTEMLAMTTDTSTLDSCIIKSKISHDTVPLDIVTKMPVMPQNSDIENTPISPDNVTLGNQVCMTAYTSDTETSATDQVASTSNMSVVTHADIPQLQNTELKSVASDNPASTIEAKKSPCDTMPSTSVQLGSTSTMSANTCSDFSQLNPNTDLKTTVITIPSSEIHELTEINRGAFGIVMKGVWNGTNVAMKKIPIRRMKAVKKMVQRELQVNASIRHPNIVLLMGYNVEGSELQLVSEYVDGPNLEQVLFDETNIPFSYEQRLSTGYQISAAVAYLHTRKPLVVHRDIKPENIILSKSLTTAKLCDMGLSKFKSMTTFITTMASGNSSQPGTPVYQAPEMYLHRSSSSTATDMWSLSATAVELFSGEMIWEVKEVDDDFNSDGCLETTMCGFMKLKQQPHGLVKLLEMDIPVKLKEIVTQGLDYCAEKRINAVTMCLALKEMMTC